MDGWNGARDDSFEKKHAEAMISKVIGALIAMDEEAWPLGL